MFVWNPTLVVIAAIMDLDISSLVRLAAQDPVMHATPTLALHCSRNFLAQHYFCSTVQQHPDLEMIAKSVTFPSRGTYVGTYVELKSRPGYPPVAIIPQAPFQFELVWPEGLGGRGATTRQSVNLCDMRGEHYDRGTAFGQLYLAGIQGGGFNFFHVADDVSLVVANPLGFPRQ